MKGIHLDQYIYVNDDKDINANKFIEEFVTFIESKGYITGGSATICDENGELINNNCDSCKTVNFESCSRCKNK